MYADMPYREPVVESGALVKSVAPAVWDVAWSAQDLGKCLEQWGAASTQTPSWLVLKHHWRHAQTYREFITSTKGMNVQPLVWERQDYNLSGMSRMLESTEYMTLAMQPTHAYNMDATETNEARHNLLIGTCLRGWYKDSNKNIVNKAQSPMYLAMEACKVMGVPGPAKWVLVPTAGTGSDALGLIAAGYNVVAVDKDDIQYENMVNRATAMATRCENDCKEGGLLPAEWMLKEVAEEGFGAFGFSAYAKEKQARADEKQKEADARKAKAKRSSAAGVTSAAGKAEAPEEVLCFDCNKTVTLDIVCALCKTGVHEGCQTTDEMEQGGNTHHTKKGCVEFYAKEV